VISLAIQYCEKRSNSAVVPALRLCSGQASAGEFFHLFLCGINVDLAQKIFIKTLLPRRREPNFVQGSAAQNYACQVQSQRAGHFESIFRYVARQINRNTQSAKSLIVAGFQAFLLLTRCYTTTFSIYQSLLPVHSALPISSRALADSSKLACLPTGERVQFAMASQQTGKKILHQHRGINRHWPFGQYPADMSSHYSRTGLEKLAIDWRRTLSRLLSG
jgi:hypothetical protein